MEEIDCPLCNQKFDTEEELTSHKQGSHSEFTETYGKEQDEDGDNWGTPEETAKDIYDLGHPEGDKESTEGDIEDYEDSQQDEDRIADDEQREEGEAEEDVETGWLDPDTGELVQKRPKKMSYIDPDEEYSKGYREDLYGKKGSEEDRRDDADSGAFDSALSTPYNADAEPQYGGITGRRTQSSPADSGISKNDPFQSPDDVWTSGGQKADEDAVGGTDTLDRMATPYDEQQDRFRNERDQQSPLDNIYSAKEEEPVEKWDKDDDIGRNYAEPTGDDEPLDDDSYWQGRMEEAEDKEEGEEIIGAIGMGIGAGARIAGGLAAKGIGKAAGGIAARIDDKGASGPLNKVADLSEGYDDKHNWTEICPECGKVFDNPADAGAHSHAKEAHNLTNYIVHGKNTYPAGVSNLKNNHESYIPYAWKYAKEDVDDVLDHFTPPEDSDVEDATCDKCGKTFYSGDFEGMQKHLSGTHGINATLNETRKRKANENIEDIEVAGGDYRLTGYNDSQLECTHCGKSWIVGAYPRSNLESIEREASDHQMSHEPLDSLFNISGMSGVSDGSCKRCGQVTDDPVGHLKQEHGVDWTGESRKRRATEQDTPSMPESQTTTPISLPAPITGATTGATEDTGDESNYEIDVDEYIKTGYPTQKIPKDKRADEEDISGPEGGPGSGPQGDDFYEAGTMQPDSSGSHNMYRDMSDVKHTGQDKYLDMAEKDYLDDNYELSNKDYEDVYDKGQIREGGAGSGPTGGTPALLPEQTARSNITPDYDAFKATPRSERLQTDPELSRTTEQDDSDKEDEEYIEDRWQDKINEFREKKQLKRLGEVWYDFSKEERVQIFESLGITQYDSYILAGLEYSNITDDLKKGIVKEAENGFNFEEPEKEDEQEKEEKEELEELNEAYAFTYDLENNHRSRDFKKKSLTCTRCNETFYNNNDRNVHFNELHMKAEEYELPDQCPFCQEIIKEPETLDYHMQQDHGAHISSQYTQTGIQGAMADAGDFGIDQDFYSEAVKGEKPSEVDGFRVGDRVKIKKDPYDKGGLGDSGTVTDFMWSLYREEWHVVAMMENSVGDTSIPPSHLSHESKHKAREFVDEYDGIEYDTNLPYDVSRFLDNNGAVAELYDFEIMSILVDDVGFQRDIAKVGLTMYNEKEDRIGGKKGRESRKHKAKETIPSDDQVVQDWWQLISESGGDGDYMSMAGTGGPEKSPNYESGDPVMWDEFSSSQQQALIDRAGGIGGMIERLINEGWSEYVDEDEDSYESVSNIINESRATDLKKEIKNLEKFIHYATFENPLNMGSDRAKLEDLKAELASLGEAKGDPLGLGFKHNDRVPKSGKNKQLGGVDQAHMYAKGQALQSRSDLMGDPEGYHWQEGGEVDEWDKEDMEKSMDDFLKNNPNSKPEHRDPDHMQDTKVDDYDYSQDDPKNWEKDYSQETFNKISDYFENDDGFTWDCKICGKGMVHGGYSIEHIENNHGVNISSLEDDAGENYAKEDKSHYSDVYESEEQARQYGATKPVRDEDTNKWYWNNEAWKFQHGEDPEEINWNAESRATEQNPDKLLEDLMDEDGNPPDELGVDDAISYLTKMGVPEAEAKDAVKRFGGDIG